MTHRKILFTMLALMLTKSVTAFDGVEHERVSDHAFFIALTYWANSEQRDIRSADEACDQLIAPLGASVLSLVRYCFDRANPDSDRGRPLTYGGANRLVDELQYPRQLFVREYIAEEGGDVQVAIASDYAALNPPFNVRREDRKRLGTGALEVIRSLSNNEVHFQNEAVDKLFELRAQATGVAQSNLYQSLILNAMSDHFLYDLWAPGHVLWPRRNAHDSVASGVHDKSNRRGAGLFVNARFYAERLASISEYVTAHRALYEDYAARTLDWLRPRSDRPTTSCDEGRAGLVYALACVDQAVSQRRPIALYGDAMMSRSPEQQALLLLVQVERLVDLLQRSTGAEGSLVPRPAPISSYMKTPKGALAFRVPTFEPWYGLYEFYCEACEGFAYASEDQVFRKSVSHLIGLNIGGQSRYSGFSLSRSRVSLDFHPLDWLAENDWIRDTFAHKPVQSCGNFNCNIGMSLGPSYLHSDDLSAIGGDLRVFKAWPSIDFQVGLYGSRMKYRTANGDLWRTGYGVRTDVGFSVFTFYLAVGKDHFLDGAGGLQRSGAVSFGLSASIATARLRKALQTDRWYRNPNPDHAPR